MKSTCVILCPGPSMDDVTEEMLAGKTVICVSRAGPLRDYRCDWWVIGSFWSNASLVIPAGVKVCANGAIMNGRDGITNVALRAIAKCPLNYSLAGDALRLAWHLGHRDIEVFGADWCGNKSLYRWVRESAEWWETVQRLGLSVTRNGERMRELPVASFFWKSEGRVDMRMPFKERGQTLQALQDAEVAAVVRRAGLAANDVRENAAFYYVFGEAAKPFHDAVAIAVTEGKVTAWRNELGMMYELPDAAGRKGMDCPRGERAPDPRPAGATPPRPVPKRETTEARWARVGPKMWAELHARPAAYTGDAAIEREWLESFAERIACGECKTHWRAMTAATPPDLASAGAYYQWTVAAHNTVNVRLGKPVWGGSDYTG